jgi:hypothetical protein
MRQTAMKVLQLTATAARQKGQHRKLAGNNDNSAVNV